MGDMLTVYRDERDAALAERDALQTRVAEFEGELAEMTESRDWNVSCTTQYRDRCDALRKALEKAQQALNTWVATYAGEECSAEVAEKARHRIMHAGGTLAYIADVSAHIRAALQPSPSAAGEE